MDSMLHIKASPKQLSKLRNGHKVRVSPAVKGEGFNLIVHPERYNTITKSFNKKKGIELQLTPDEIMVNKSVHPQMEGKGIFGRDFDKFVEKTIGTKAKDIIYKSADELKPMLKEGINKASEYAPELGATALSSLAMMAGQPELVPFASALGSQMGTMAGSYGKKYASDYLDNPEKYQGYTDTRYIDETPSERVMTQIGNKDVYAPKTLQGAVEQNEVFRTMNKDLGTQYGNLARATLGNLDAQIQRAGVPMVRSPYTPRPYITPEYMRTPTPEMLPSPPPKRKGKKKGRGLGEDTEGHGLYASGSARMGKGLYAGMGLGRELSSIGRGGGFVDAKNALPTALQSQPFGSNFQFRYTLPPQYQRFASGGVYA
jgi:hypothetical protein